MLRSYPILNQKWRANSSLVYQNHRNRAAKIVKFEVTERNEAKVLRTDEHPWIKINSFEQNCIKSKYERWVNAQEQERIGCEFKQLHCQVWGQSDRVQHFWGKVSVVQGSVLISYWSTQKTGTNSPVKKPNSQWTKHQTSGVAYFLADSMEIGLEKNSFHPKHLRRKRTT